MSEEAPLISQTRIFLGFIGLLLWAAERVMDQYELIPHWVALGMWALAGLFGVLFFPPSLGALRFPFVVLVVAFGAFFTGAAWNESKRLPDQPKLSPELRPQIAIYPSKRNKTEITPGHVIAWFTVENRGKTTAKGVTVNLETSELLMPRESKINPYGVLDYLPEDKYDVSIEMATYLGRLNESIIASAYWTNIYGDPDETTITFAINYEDGRFHVTEKMASSTAAPRDP